MARRALVRTANFQIYSEDAAFAFAGMDRWERRAFVEAIRKDYGDHMGGYVHKMTRVIGPNTDFFRGVMKLALRLTKREAIQARMDANSQTSGDLAQAVAIQSRAYASLQGQLAEVDAELEAIDNELEATMIAAPAEEAPSVVHATLQDAFDAPGAQTTDAEGAVEAKAGEAELAEPVLAPVAESDVKPDAKPDAKPASTETPAPASTETPAPASTETPAPAPARAEPAPAEPTVAEPKPVVKAPVAKPAAAAADESKDKDAKVKPPAPAKAPEAKPPPVAEPVPEAKPPATPAQAYYDRPRTDPGCWPDWPGRCMGGALLVPLCARTNPM